MKRHELKTDPAAFQAVYLGTKTHEIRFNDRDFAVGDELLLHETVFAAADLTPGQLNTYTGRELLRCVSHIQEGYGLAPDWVILSLELPAAVRDVLAERRRQIEGDYDHAHDDAYPNGEIAAYAAFYAMPPAVRDWPAAETGYGATWGEAIIPEDWTPPKPGDRRRELEKAAALVLAEMERIDRANPTTTGEKE